MGMLSLNNLNVSELKAILAHEYGHFTNKDTAWNSLTFTTQGVLFNALANMPQPSGQGGLAYMAISLLNPAWWTLIAYSRLCSIFTNGFSRIEEVFADKHAVEYYGYESFSSGLQKISRNEHILNDFGSPSSIVKQIKKKGFDYKNIYEYLEWIESNLKENDWLKEIDKKICEGERESIFDSHPLLQDRIKYAAYFAKESAKALENVPVKALFSDWSERVKFFSEPYNQLVADALYRADGGTLYSVTVNGMKQLVLNKNFIADVAVFLKVEPEKLVDFCMKNPSISIGKLSDEREKKFTEIVQKYTKDFNVQKEAMVAEKESVEGEQPKSVVHEGEDGNRFRVCSKCKERNNPAFANCWKCKNPL
jgi:hypothetical protein